jgi:VWFA-related protein
MRAKLQIWTIQGMIALCFCIHVHTAASQTDATPAQGDPSYRVVVTVDEVTLTFHAADAQGLPVNDLRLDELHLLDNGKPPRKISGFYTLEDHPLRAGILFDTSESMHNNLQGNRTIAMQYAQHLFRQDADKAFVMDFGYISNIAQNWTSDPTALTATIRHVTPGKGNPLGGTAIFDTIFRACLYQFGKVDRADSGKFILLFSDGEDNASHTSLQEAVGQCQRTNTAIYAFRAESEISASTGPRTLAELASQTGGRVFRDDESDAEITANLRTIEADLRNQYLLVYKPAELQHDGSFHRIELRASPRVDSITVRTGYYAPAR